MQLIDITIPIRPGMLVYPGDPPVRIELAAALARGDDANVTHLDLSAHTGTHVDAPIHYVEGAAGIDALPLATLVGPAVVVDARAVTGGLDAEALSRLDLPDVPRLLFRTRNGELADRADFAPDCVQLTVDGAAALVARGARLVGIDYLTVGGQDVHRTLLQAGVVIVEGVDLRAAEPGRYELACLPLKIAGSDGAPARVVLIRP